MRTRAALLLLVSAFFVVSVCPIALVAQSPTATINGRISDPGGLPIQGAKVQATNVDTNVVYPGETNADGFYSIVNIAPGNYRVIVQKDGFAQVVKPGVELHVQDIAGLNFSMKVGSIEQSITVEAGAPQVETVNPTIGGTVTGAPIQDLPLNGRNVLDLALTQPGVTPAPGGPLSKVGFPSGTFSVSGGRDDSVTYLLDGGDNTSVTYGVPVMNSNPDTIAEFRILNNNYTAQYGRSAGGVVSVVTKSGTNQLHGSVFDYLRNDAFNANTFFNNEAGVARPALKRNQFGGTVGGPIIIPNVVRGKDRAFFFFGYQGQRQNSVTVGSEVTTFTPAELSGNFSHSVNGGPDPNVAAFLQSHPSFQSNPALAAQATIDPTKIHPVAQAYIANNLIPVSSSGLLVPNGSGTDNSDQYLGRLDTIATTKDKFSLTLSKTSNPVAYPFTTDRVPNVPGFPANNQIDAYLGNIAYTRTFSPNLLNEFYFTAQYLKYKLNFPARKLPGPADLGVNITPDETTGPPQILLLRSNLQLGFQTNGPAVYADTTYDYADTVTWVRGRHTWKAGGSLAVVQNNAFFDFSINGQFRFFGRSSGNDKADFLFGAPNLFLQFAKGLSAVRSHQYAGFVEDQWRVTPHLVLTLGVRYEYSTPKSDPKARNYTIIPGLQSTRYPHAPLGLVFPGDSGAPTGVSFPDKNNWAPRIGFAWDPFGKGTTSIRGGFGIFYDVLLGQTNQAQNGTPPFFPGVVLRCFRPTCQPFLADPYGALGTPNAFPSSSLPPPQNLDFVREGFIPYGPSSVFIDPHEVTPYIYHYNLSLQQQLGQSLAFQIGYAGSSSHKLEAKIDRNPIIPGTDTFLLNTQPGLQIPDAFSQMSEWNTNAANANYNSLMVSLTKRMGDWHSIGQTFFTLSYTWSHNIDDAEGALRNNTNVPFFNHHQFRASADSDIPSRFVFSGGWELPFGHLWPSGPKRLIGGWTLYPIAFVQSGLPMDVTAGLFPDGTPGPSGVGDQNLVRPDWAGGAPQTLDPHAVQTFNVTGTAVTGHFAFDPSGLAIPACYSDPTCPTSTYGTLRRNFFRAPGRFNVDLALEKRVSLVGERLQAAFRAEFFNILNHTQWQSPILSAPIYSPQVGQITSTYDPRIGQLALRFTF